MFASSLVKVKYRDISRLIRRVSAKPGEEVLSEGSFVQKLCNITVVGEGGLEPPHPFEYRHLKPARLPISPLALRPRHISPRGERGLERPRNDCRDRYSKGCHGFEKG